MNKLKGCVYFLTLLWLIFFFLAGYYTIQQIYKDRDFKTERMEPVIQFIDNFKKQKHRLPTRQEFINSYYQGDQVDYRPSKYGDYNISIWRGEWYESYASRTKTYDHPPSERIWLMEGLALIFVGCIPLVLFHLFIRKYFKSKE